MLRGGCMCGQVRYEIDGPIHSETLCHCGMCRRSAGAPAVAWFTAPRSGFRLLSGTPTRYRASAWATRSFCPSCGTQLSFEHDRYPDELDVTTCSLDDPTRCAPRDHTRTSARLPWLKLADDLPQYPEARDTP